MAVEAGEGLRDAYVEYEVLFTPARVRAESERYYLYRGVMRVSRAGVLFDGHTNVELVWQVVTVLMSVLAIYLGTDDILFGILLGWLVALLAALVGFGYQTVHGILVFLMGRRMRRARYLNLDDGDVFYDTKNRVMAFACSEGEDDWMFVKPIRSSRASFDRLLNTVSEVLGERLEPAAMGRMPRVRRWAVTVLLVAGAMWGFMMVILTVLGAI